jgi:small subunit ribosomal protein S2
MVAQGKTVLFVGTKRQAQEAIAEEANRCQMFYVNQRWLGGMLTNFSTVFKRLQRLKELEEIDFSDVAGSGMTKRELLQMRRERDKLDKTLGGIRHMSKVPSAVWVIDTKKEHIAIAEARKLGIPIVAILDTNCDPDEVNYPIPGNDDAIRSVALLTRVVADAVADGLMSRSGAGDGDEKPSTDGLPVEEPLAEWERELAQSDATPAEIEATDGEAPVITEPATANGTEAAATNGTEPEATPAAAAPAEATQSEATQSEVAQAEVAREEAAPAEVTPVEAATETEPAAAAEESQGEPVAAGAQADASADAE